jgi:Carboxypeptidase regulatory-like domain
MKQSGGNLRLVAFIVALFGLLGPGAVMAFGQAVDGNLIGTVLDSQGAAVVGAEMAATNIATNVTDTTKTSNSGEYRFDHLLAGTYRITAKMTGFKTVSEMVSVELNKTGTRNLTLIPGAATETIEVSGVPPTLDTTSSQIQSTYTPKELADLPSVSSGSGVVNLSLLDAGVASSGGVGLGSGPSISGQRPRNNNYTVEGVDNNNKGVTGPLFAIPNDAVDQFTVLQNQFSPEFGHSSGGQFNQTVKSGSNSFHGKAYEYFQNRKLNALDSQLALAESSAGFPKIYNTPFDNNRYGGQLGGPIVKNKVFFFTDWEYNPIKNYSFSTGCAPTANGYATLTADIGPVASGGVNATNLAQFQKYAGTAGTQAALDGSNPNCAPYAAGFGDGNGGPGSVEIGAVGYAGAYYSNFLTGINSIDWNISDKDQVRARYAYSKNNAIDFAGQISSFWTVTPVKNHLFTLSEYHTFTPNVNNEVRVGFNHFTQNFPDGGFSYPGLDAFPNLIVGFGEGNGVQLGADPNAPQFAVQGFYQLVDNISWVKGNHNLKFGGEYREYISPQGFTQRKRGDYDYTTFQGFFTDQVPDYLAERSIGSVTYYGNQNMFYGFANDDWHVRKNFSVNLGLRYEFTQPPLSERKWQPLNAISNAPGVITFAAPKAQTKNFLPRLGFAWSPGSSGNTSIRGGFAMAVDVLYDNLGLLSAPPQVQQTCDAAAGTPVDQMTGSCFWGDPTVTGTGFLASSGLPFASTIPPITDVAQARLATSGYIPDQKLPYSETWSFGIQHIFAQKYTVEVRYVGTRGIHLPVQARLNRQRKTSSTAFLPTFFTAPDQATLDALALKNTYSSINANSSYVPAYLNLTLPNGDPAGFTGNNVVGFMPWGTSRYNGLQTQVRRSFSNGLQLQAAWTWSHAMDDSTADVFSTYITPRRAQDSNCFRCDFADSALDRRHRVTLQALYDIPFLKHDDNWFKKNIVGNWELGPVYTFQSPEYATVQSGLDVNGNGDSAGDRTIINPSGVKGTGSGSKALCSTLPDPKLVCGTIDPGQPDDTRKWIVAYLAKNSSAYYVTAGKFALPNARRNTLAMPRTNNVDFTLVKRLNFTESQSLEFQFQAFNLLNHAQYLPGNISDVAPAAYTGSNVLAMLEPNSPTFNQPRSVFSNHPRGLTLVLKYTF